MVEDQSFDPGILHRLHAFRGGVRGWVRKEVGKMIKGLPSPSDISESVFN